MVLKLIALPDSELGLRPLIEHVYDTSASPHEAHALFRDYLLGADPTHATAIFAFWKDLNHKASPAYFCRDFPTPHSLTLALVRYFLEPHSLIWDVDDFVTFCKASRRVLANAEVRRLTRARNVWVRALTRVTFPRRYDHRQLEILMAELRRLNRPLPASAFQRLRTQLDNPRFTVRERAAAELLRVGDAVEPALRDALKQRPALELRRRIERLLVDIDRGVPDPLRYETLAHLASTDTPEARAVLQTLAGGLPHARLTREAAAALAQPKGYRFKRPETPRQPLYKPELLPPTPKR